MDSRYWKEFENMGDMEADKHSGSEGSPPRYSKDSKNEMISRRKRSRTESRSRSHSSSSSSSGSSSRSSSSSSRRHSDHHNYRNNKQDLRYHRGGVRGSSYGSGREEVFPPSHPSAYPNQGQEMPSSSSYIPPPYAQAPPSVQGQFRGNYEGQNYQAGNYHGGYAPYDSGPPPPPNYYPHNFPHGSQPPPAHEYGLSGGPPPSNWEMFPDTTFPPPNLMQPPVSGDAITNIRPDLKTEEAKKEAIEQELLQQKRTLAKQREDYVRRKFSLNRELNRLKDQKRELLKEKSKENERILRENAKLQGEIQQKLKSIDNVIEMLTNIIGDSAHLPDVIKEIKNMEKASEKPKKTEKRKHSPGDERRTNEPGDKDCSPSQLPREENFVFYDPGLHWCSDCNIFPKTVSDYLDHLHTHEHKHNSKLRFEDFPWHVGQTLSEKSPQYSKEFPPKRIPIRGVQFLIPASALYCSMCKIWLGDNHCASKHVKSSQHAQNYSDFIMRHPHWEVDWLTERTRSYERNSEAKQQESLRGEQNPHTLPAAPTPSSYSIASLSDQLLAMITANSKTQETPIPPPPPAMTKSSSSSSAEDESPDRKLKKKRKKSKKSKRVKERKSPSKEKVVHHTDQIKLNYKSMPERKVDTVPVDDTFISEWMPRVDKHETVQLKKKPREMGDGKFPLKRVRGKSESREPSIECDKKPSPYDQIYNDHDEAVVFDKRPPYFDKDSRNKKRNEEESKHERHSRYDRESPREKSRYDDRYKYRTSDKHKYEKDDKDLKHDDHKVKKDMKLHKDLLNEKERNKKSPLPRIKDSIEKKKLKAKAERSSDDDTHETSFEKRTSESAAKKKDVRKQVLNSLPKTKLPFIGRMPILKKKVEQKSDEKDDKKDPVEEDPIKDLRSESSHPEPVSTEVVVSNLTEPSIEELPKSTLIISKRPRLAEPGIVRKEILFNKPANDNLTEQDMELDDDSGVPKEDEPAKDELHKDFKDALDLLFPEEKKKEEGEDSESKGENEIKLDDQQQVVSAAATAGYMMPAGYDVSMYPAYYDQQAYVQQWAQMGYDQAAQYPGAYGYPPPIEQASMEVAVQQQQPSIDNPQPEVKKKKNPLSQRMRRHLQKKRAQEASEKQEEIKDEEKTMDGKEELGELEGETIEDEQENGDENDEMPQASSAAHKRSDMSMSDLAMLGIDEDDTAAQGFH